MEVNITNKNDKDIKIAIAKDFGFKDCYPIIDFNSLEIYTIQGKKSINLHFENYYDLLETDIYNSHDENYYIYIFEVQNNNKLAFINKNNVYISNIKYYDSLTKYNKYNFNPLISSGDVVSEFTYPYLRGPLHKTRSKV